MARKTGAPRKRRGPDRRRTGQSPAKARRSQHGTLTFEKFQKLLSEPPRLPRDPSRYPWVQQALEDKRSAIRDGDLLALSSALDLCFTTARRGFSFEDASLNPELSSNFQVCEIPAWLLGELLLLINRGMSGDWPKAVGGAAPARRYLSMQRDLWRTGRVLKARKAGVPWVDVFRHVVEESGGRAGSPAAVRDSYERVARNLSKDPRYYNRFSHIAFFILDAAVGPPTRG